MNPSSSTQPTHPLFKRSYSTPTLIVHGDVEKITQQGTGTNSDMPAGIVSTAYPVLHEIS